MYILKQSWKLNPNQNLGKMIDDFKNSEEYKNYVNTIINDDIKYYVNLIKKFKND